MNREMYVYKSVAESRVTNVHHIIHSVLTGSRSPAGPRCLGTATRIMRIAVPKAFCVLREHTRPSPKSGKTCRSDTRPGDVCERAERSEGSDTTPHPKRPVFRRVSRCVRSFSESRVCTRFRSEGKRGPFVREVEKQDEKRLGDKIYGSSFARFSSSAGVEGSQRTGKCMYIKAWRNIRYFAGGTKPHCGRGGEGPCFAV